MISRPLAHHPSAHTRSKEAQALGHILPASNRFCFVCELFVSSGNPFLTRRWEVKATKASKHRHYRSIKRILYIG
jgi:hypothetical protein